MRVPPQWSLEDPACPEHQGTVPASARAGVSLQLKGVTDVSQAWWGAVLLSHP